VVNIGSPLSFLHTLRVTFARSIISRLQISKAKSQQTFDQNRFNKLSILEKISVFGQKLLKVTKKYKFVIKNSIFDQNVDFLNKISIFITISFLTKMSIFEQHFDFWPKFRFLTNISIFMNISFLTKMSIFAQNFYFRSKCRFLTKISIFDQNFDFWPKFRFLINISI